MSEALITAQKALQSVSLILKRDGKHPGSYVGKLPQELVDHLIEAQESIDEALASHEAEQHAT